MCLPRRYTYTTISAPQPNQVDELVFDTFMENSRNNVPLTSDSSDQPINISYDTKIEYEPEPYPITDPKKIDDLVWKFKSEANERIHYAVHDCKTFVNPAQSDVV